MSRKHQEPRVSKPLLRACRELLRHADHPVRLKGNILLQKLCPHGIPPPSFSHRLRRFLSEALEHVTPRQQCIVTRCDLGGERILDVANRLGISERHAFRERTKAHEAIASYVCASDFGSASHLIVVSDPTDLLFASARSFEQSGQAKRALDILTTSLPQVSDPLNQCRIEIRLAQLNLSVGLLKTAKQNLLRARTLGSQVDRDNWLNGYPDLADAYLAWKECKVDIAEQLLRKALTHLRRSSLASSDYRGLDALALALRTRALFDFDSGHLEEAGRSAAEGLAVIDRSPAPDATIFLRLRAAQVAFVRAGEYSDNDYAAKYLSDCYTQANSQNLLRDAIGIRLRFGTLLRQIGQIGRAQTVLSSTLSFARLYASPDLLADALFEHAIVDNLQNRPHDALAKLAEAAPYNRLFARDQHTATLVEATSYLRLQDYGKALEKAEMLESHYRSTGLRRLAAESLEIRALALAGLTRFAEARQAADSAAETFERIGMLARAIKTRALPLRVPNDAETCVAGIKNGKLRVAESRARRLPDVLATR